MPNHPSLEDLLSDPGAMQRRRAEVQAAGFTPRADLERALVQQEHDPAAFDRMYPADRLELALYAEHRAAAIKAGRFAESEKGAPKP